MNFSNFQFKNCPGIYKITNILTEKFYIGSSKIIHKRLSRHFWELRNKKHSNSYMQRAFNKYGPEAFIIEIMEECEEEILIEREQFYIDTFKPEYNLIPIAGKTTRGRKLTEEQKAHLSNINVGHEFSYEAKKKISLKTKGFKKPRNVKKKIKKVWKSTYSEERKISIGRSKAKISDEVIILIRKLSKEENLMYKEISKITGIDYRNIGKIVRKETYKWVD